MPRQEDSAGSYGGIRYVKGRPVVRTRVEVQEVNNRSIADPVYQVSKCSAEYQRDSPCKRIAAAAGASMVLEYFSFFEDRALPSGVRAENNGRGFRSVVRESGAGTMRSFVVKFSTPTDFTDCTAQSKAVCLIGYFKPSRAFLASSEPGKSS